MVQLKVNKRYREFFTLKCIKGVKLKPWVYLVLSNAQPCKVT